MRLIGHVTGETGAQLFSDYLSSLEIKSSIEPDSAGKWAIWIYSEDQVEVGKQHLAEYLAHPSDPKYAQGARQGEKVQTKEREAEAKLGERVYTRETIFQSNTGIGIVTLSLIVICAVLSVYTGFSDKASVVLSKLHTLFISEQFFASFLKHTELNGFVKFLPEVREGEVWRLVTPVFVHFGILHILFNMLMLKDLGTMIEVRRGSWALIGLVIGFAIASNLLQYWYDGPVFGGMSGVLYGLFGYIWMRGRWDPGSGLYLHQQTVVGMMIWFVLCAVNIIPHVANAAHAGGLIAGIIWGLAPLIWRRRG
jgi:GlpG protein